MGNWQLQVPQKNKDKGYVFSKAYRTKYHKLNNLNNRNIFSQSSRS